MRLKVELYDTRVGTLEGDSRSFDFHPTPEALARFGTNSTALSVAVPLTPTPRRDQAARRRNWFAELLPEGNQYEYLLTQGGIRSGEEPGAAAPLTRHRGPWSRPTTSCRGRT